MCQSDRAVYEEALRLAKEGYMPPLIVQQDDIQGYGYFCLFELDSL